MYLTEQFSLYAMILPIELALTARGACHHVIALDVIGSVIEYLKSDRT